MSTWLEAVNAVQIRLRETQTASVTTSTYSTLIGAFVNQAKREVEDAWNWSALRQDVTLTTVSGTKQYALTGSNARSRMFGERAAYDSVNDIILREVPDWFMDRDTHIGTTQNADAVYYRFRGISSGVKQVDLYPTPNSVTTIEFPMVIPQADITVDGTEITIPADPIIMRAWALAISERGEDGGANFSEVDNMARMALGDAIGVDVAQHVGETTWNAD